jgi:hypothetical protein
MLVAGEWRSDGVSRISLSSGRSEFEKKTHFRRFWRDFCRLFRNSKKPLENHMRYKQQTTQKQERDKKQEEL